MAKTKDNTITLDDYEAARKSVERMRPKIEEAQTVIRHWREAVKSHPDLIGKKVLKAIAITETGYDVLVGDLPKPTEREVTNGSATPIPA